MREVSTAAGHSGACERPCIGRVYQGGALLVSATSIMPLVVRMLGCVAAVLFAATALQVSTKTVARDWEFARAWLHRQMAG